MTNSTDVFDLYNGHIPSLGGSVTFLILFSLITILQLVFGVITKQWPFMLCWIVGLTFEITGYAGRLKSHFIEGTKSHYVVQYSFILVAPCLFMFGIYYLFGQLVVILDSRFSQIVKTKLYSFVFVVCDIISLVVQVAGCIVIARDEASDYGMNTGRNIIVGGLSCQLISMCVFLFVWIKCLLKSYKEYRKHGSQGFNEDYSPIREGYFFKYFMASISLAVLAIFIRTMYRIIELSENVHSEIGNNERYLLSLESSMSLFAASLLTVFYPGFIYGRGNIIPLRNKELHTSEGYNDLKLFDSSYDPFKESGNESDSTVADVKHETVEDFYRNYYRSHRFIKKPAYEI